MPEVRNVEVQQIDEKCPVCKNGWMRPTGIVVTGQPTQYEHKCTSCGYKQSYGVRYPYSIN